MKVNKEVMREIAATNKEGVNEMNKDINKEFEQCVYSEVKDLIKDLERNLKISVIKGTISYELMMFRQIKDKVKKIEMELLEVTRKEIEKEKKRGVTENSINKTLIEIYSIKKK